MTCILVEVRSGMLPFGLPAVAADTQADILTGTGISTSWHWQRFKLTARMMSCLTSKYQVRRDRPILGLLTY